VRLASALRPSGSSTSRLTPIPTARRNLGYLGDVVTEDDIRRAAEILARNAQAPARVILFGSHAGGTAGRHSDLDFLVVEEDVPSRFDEMVRLRDALPPLGVPVDVLVVSESYAADWGDVRGTVLHEALTKGKVLAAS
jgi:predicted nucleotidyltransferase